MRKIHKMLMWRFDRVFGYKNKVIWQVVIILAMLAILVGIIWIVSGLFKGNYPDIENSWMQTIGLFFDASNLDPDSKLFPYWWRIVVFLLGSVLFSGVTITFVGNWLGNRQSAYKNGTVRYWFNNHLLFLGGSRIILPIIKTIASDNQLNRLHIVVLTSDNVERLRIDIDRGIPPEKLSRMKVTVLYGDHHDENTLKSVQIQLARKLYIAGDYLAGSEHDSENVACWEAAKKLCAQRKDVVPCYLYFSRSSSVKIFNHRNDTAGDCLDTTVINFLESVAQRVLVHNGYEQNDYPNLDRNGIGPDSKRTVHFVVVGVSQATSVSYAMATAAAHLCHFPNSVILDPQTGLSKINTEHRTKITYIAPNIEEEMNMLVNNHDELFKLSNYVLLRNGIEVYRNEIDPTVGDFLDIEWEFIEGKMTDRWIVEKLNTYYDDCVTNGKTYLTMAFCDLMADRNIAAAVNLPTRFHTIHRHEDTNTIDYEKTIPLLVYQPNNERLMQNAHKDVKCYENMLPFGSLAESYDPSIRRRIKEGKRINYIYIKGFDYQYMTSDQNCLDKEWLQLNYLKQMSNIHSANHIGVKLRSMGIGAKELQLRKKIVDSYDVELMAIVEHNRWNVEKLLLGYAPAERHKIKKLKDLESEIKKYQEQDNSPEKQDLIMQMGQLEQELNNDKKYNYIHNCIAPFDMLLVKSQNYDRLIVRNLTDVL